MESSNSSGGEGTEPSVPISTRLQRIAELARKMPEAELFTLAHHIDVDFFREAYRRIRKDGAPGVDGQTAAEYERHLEVNLRSLLDRFKSGRYRAPPVRRVHIPKGDGRSRPIGIPTLEDKVLQKAVAMVLEAVYEQDFRDCSWGFRPGRSAHGALEALWKAIMEMEGGWVLEVDIQSFFDDVDHAHLRDIFGRRVRDGVLRRMVGKWLKAGVMEEGRYHRPDSGTPQGGVISPLLANVYLHEAMDGWFEETVRPHLQGRAHLIRYADDLVIVFEREDDARRVERVLPKRLGKYGLRLHPEKTRLVRFERPPKGDKRPRGRSFDFLGFRHFWGRSRRGSWVVKRKTAPNRFTRALKRVADWCRRHRHEPVAWQHEILCRKLRGHYAYYGITGNTEALSCFRYEVGRVWRKWLMRRSQRTRLRWDRFNRLLKRYTLPPPRVVRSVYPSAAKP